VNFFFTFCVGLLLVHVKQNCKDTLFIAGRVIVFKIFPSCIQN